jgi:hypothetical protein
MATVEDSVAILSQRNEGPFLLEWIAWYRMLGFDRIVVIHNDCTDHSPQLLRLLEREGIVFQKKHEPDPDRPPQPQAHRKVARLPAVKSAQWAFVCDADEFLVIHPGDGLLADLIAAWPAGAEAMTIHWKIYGTDGAEAWTDQLVHRSTTRCAAPQAQQNTQFKSLTRHPSHWHWLRSHGPIGWRGPGPWAEDDPRVVRADGTPFPGYNADGAPLNGTGREEITHALAQVNHYALQSRERFALKEGTRSAAAHLDRYSEDFFRRFDHNGDDDPVALKYAARFDAEHAALRAIPGVLRLHHLCCADYLAAIAAKLGRPEAAYPAIAVHRETAAALPRHATPAGD